MKEEKDVESQLNGPVESSSILIEPNQVKKEEEEKEKEEKETKGEKEEDMQTISGGKDTGMALMVEVTEQTHQHYLDQLERQVQRNKANPKVEL